MNPVPFDFKSYYSQNAFNKITDQFAMYADTLILNQGT